MVFIYVQSLKITLKRRMRPKRAKTALTPMRASEEVVMRHRRACFFAKPDPPQKKTLFTFKSFIKKHKTSVLLHQNTNKTTTHAFIVLKP
jgi:hypothetical protein